MQEVQEKPKFYRAEDVAKILGIGESTAYRIIRNMNQKLNKDGYYTVAGKISRRFFEEKVYL